MDELYVTCSKNPKKISINPDFIDDPFYRYTMHQVIIDFNKDKTFIVNIDEVAKELKINSLCILRYLGSSLGTRFNYEKKNRKAFLSGLFSADILSKYIIQFIEEVVLCNKCGLPELDYVINKDKIVLVCRSCGNTDNLDDRNIPDTLHKYITAYPHK